MKNIRELQAIYDTRKSFYGKAWIKQNKNIEYLLSYGVVVCHIVNNEVMSCDYGVHSRTTDRHIREFLKQNGFKVDNKKQIINDYCSVKNAVQMDNKIKKDGKDNEKNN